MPASAAASVTENEGDVEPVAVIVLLATEITLCVPEPAAMVPSNVTLDHEGPLVLPVFPYAAAARMNPPALAVTEVATGEALSESVASGVAEFKYSIRTSATAELSAAELMLRTTEPLVPVGTVARHISVGQPLAAPDGPTRVAETPPIVTDEIAAAALYAMHATRTRSTPAAPKLMPECVCVVEVVATALVSTSARVAGGLPAITGNAPGIMPGYLSQRLQ